MAYTLATLREAFLRRLEYENAGLFSDAEVTALANDSTQDLHLILLGLQGGIGYATDVHKIVTTAGEDTYKLPACFLLPIRVQLRSDGLAIPLRKFEIADVVAPEENMSWSVGTPPVYWVGFSLEQNGMAITFVPRPDAAYTVDVFFRETPPIYENDSDVIRLYPEWVLRDMLVKAMLRLRKDAAEHIAERDRLTMLITNSMLTTDEANPSRVALVHRAERGIGGWWR